MPITRKGLTVKQGQAMYKVCTANPDPDLRPLLVYEVVHGVYDNDRAAVRAAHRVMKQTGENVQIFKISVVEAPWAWYNAEHAGYAKPDAAA